MGLYYPVILDDHSHKRTIFRCKNCQSHLFTSDNIVSDNFRGKHGEGYLVKRVVNFKVGEPEKRTMMTGDYDVCDASCQQCKTYLGWRYVRAALRQEKYKEGKFVMEIPQLKASGIEKVIIKKELY